MWPQWNKTLPPRGTPTAAEPDSTPRIPSSRLHSSFKDVHSLLLLLDDSSPSPNPNPNPTLKTSIFHRVRTASAALRAWNSLPLPLPVPAAPASGAGDKRILVYSTSLRVFRKTFDDCRAVVSILRGLRVAVDERDLSMDSRFLSELRGVLGGKGKKRQLSLPRVFIGGRYVGGAEEVQLLHESGELRKLVEGVPAAEAGTTCECCGGVRFALCGSCDGSHKYYHTDKAAFRTCNACTENGLVRCPHCFSSSLSR